jgi:hypothetical protein
MKYTYSTIKKKNGDAVRVRHWIENFRDEDTGEVISIKRSEPIKLNGQKLVWYPQSVINKMSKEQKKQFLKTAL